MYVMCINYVSKLSINIEPICFKLKLLCYAPPFFRIGLQLTSRVPNGIKPTVCTIFVCNKFKN